MQPKTTSKIGPSDTTAISLALHIQVTDLAEHCSFCKLLTNMIDFFAPQSRHGARDASFYLDMEEAGVTCVELTSTTKESPQVEPESVAQLLVYVQVCDYKDRARLRILVL